MEYLEIKEEEYREFFKWILEKDDVHLVKELDLLLASTHNEPYIVYTKEIEEFLNTEPMKRISQINQLGTSINYNDNSYCTRLEHCKGAYKNALDFWVSKFKNKEFREDIDKSQDRKHQKNLILADLIEMLRHDDGHTMLSHALEKLICNGRANHEDIGKRILLENEEYRKTLENINPGLYNTMCYNLTHNKTAFKFLREGNIDFDRMDYVIRDLMYIGLPYSRELIESLSKNCRIREIEIEGKKQLVPVYTLKGLEFIQEFLKTRVIGYEGEYACQDRQILDAAERELCTFISDNEDIKSNFIRSAIRNYRSYDIKSINLNELLKTNDIRFYTEVLDIAMNTENTDLRNLAVLCLPTTNGALQMGVEMLDTKRKGKDLSQYSQYELEYIDRLNKLRSGQNCDLRTDMKEENKRKLYEAVDIEDESEFEQAKDKLKQILKTEDLENKGIIQWKRYINTYKSSEPIYVEDEDGKVYKLNEHPKVNMDLSAKRIMGIGVNPAVMRLYGYDETIIQSAKKVIQECKKDNESPVIQHLGGNRMSKYRVGKEPYLIGFEDR